MRRTAIVACLLLGWGRIAAAQSSCVQPPDVCAFFDRYLAAFNARDWEAFRGTFDDSITVMFDLPAPPQRIDGRIAVEALFQRVFPPPGTVPSELPPPIVPVHLRAQDFGDVVGVSFEIGGGSDAARRTVVLHRTGGGWRVVHIHGSSRS